MSNDNVLNVGGVDITTSPANVLQPHEILDDFRTWSHKIAKETHTQLRYADGRFVELDPGSVYSVLMLKLSREATTDEFYTLFGIIKASVDAAVAQGIITEGWFQGLATPITLKPPAIPEQYKNEDTTETVQWIGETRLLPVKKAKPIEVVPEPEIEEDEPEQEQSETETND